MANKAKTAALRKCFDASDWSSMPKLLAAGADPNIQNEDGKWLLASACWYGRSALVEQLLERGADPNQDGCGALLRTVLTTNADEDDMRGILAMLLARGVDVNHRFSTRMESEANGTALMVAIQASKADLAGALVEAGTDLALEDDNGYTALDWAKEMGFKALAKTIAQKSGVRVKAADLPATEPCIDAVYAGNFSARPGVHASGIPEIAKVYTAKRFPGCNNPPVHLLTLDLAKVKELPEGVARIGKLPVVFHACECDEADRYDFAIGKDGRLRPLDALGKNDCAPDDHHASSKASGVTLTRSSAKSSGHPVVVGGRPRWAQTRNEWPACPRCGQRAFFVAFVNQAKTPPTAKGRGNHLNVFVCPKCRIETIIRQST